MAHDVFVSYSVRDQVVAEAVCAALEARRIRCWMAPRDILPGVSYAEALVDAIAESSVLVLVFSAHSNDSVQVQREVERAVSKGVAVVPFRIERVPLSKAMEFLISAAQWFDALEPPLEKHLQRLPEVVRQLFARSARGADDARARFAAVVEAASQGAEEAMADAGLLHLVGVGAPRDAELARQYLEKAAEAGSARAMLYVGELHAAGDGVPANRAAAERWWRKDSQAMDVGPTSGECGC